MERQRSFLFFSFLFFSCEQQQESIAIEIAPPTEHLESISKADYLKLRDEKISEIRNESLQVINGDGTSDNPLDGFIDLDPIGGETPIDCDCTIQFTEVNIPETFPPQFDQNSFEFISVEECVEFCGFTNTFDFRSNGLCIPTVNGCFNQVPSIDILIAQGEIPFNCAIPIFQDFQFLFAAYHEQCNPNGLGAIGTMPESSITFIVRCKGNASFNSDCYDMTPTGSNFGSTGPVTITLGENIDNTGFPLEISLEGECGCDPVAMEL